MSQVHVKEKLTLNINVMWSKVLCLYHSIHLIQTKLWIDFKHQVDCNTTFKKSDSTSNLYHLFLDAHQTHHPLQNDSTLKFIIFIPVFLCLLSHFQIWAICWRIIQKVNWALWWRTFSANGNIKLIERPI